MNKKFLYTGIAIALGLFIAVLGATNLVPNSTPQAEASSHRATAIAVLKATEGNNISGTIKFTESDDGVVIEAHVNGLTPGNHGFHIHQLGDISAPDGTSTGGHYNPAGVDHSGPGSDKRHVGDMGNLEADANGHASYKRTDTVITLSGEHSIIGRGIVIHAGEDDMKTQPTGAAGKRQAVAVIGLGKRE